jgi:hypothetical protein
MLWAFSPVVPPTYNNVATVGGMSVVSKIPALKLELYLDSLPFPRGNLTFGLTIRVAGLNGLDVVAEFSRNNSE